MTAILLPTYQGARWLDAQLASLGAQTDQDWHLWISDDGSTDESAAVAQRWAEAWPGRITCLVQRQNLGFRENLRHLVRLAEADLYLWCDQDDVWLPHHVAALRSAVAGAELARGPGVPVLAFGDLEVVDADLNPVYPSLWRWQRTPPPRLVNDLRRLLVTNCVTGCAAAFNRAARDLIADKDWTPVHDHAAALEVLRAGGALVPVDEVLVKYRQHRANAIGARRFGDGLAEKLRQLFSGSAEVYARRAVEWGLFRTRWGYYSVKGRVWLRRFLGW